MHDYRKINYKDKPFSHGKQYIIQPLSEKGIKDYFSKDSYTRNYLNKVDSNLVEEFKYHERSTDYREKKNSENGRDNIKFYKNIKEYSNFNLGITIMYY